MKRLTLAVTLASNVVLAGHACCEEAKPGIALAQCTQDGFFPSLSLSVRKDLHDFRVGWYSKHLVAMQEPVLASRQNADLEAYRLLVLPTWGHPVAIRWERRGAEGQPQLTIKELGGAGGYDPGKLIRNETKGMDAASWAAITGEVTRRRVWRMPAELNDGGCDGTQVILELVAGGRYHVVDRWSRIEHREYNRLAKAVLAASGLKPEILGVGNALVVREKQVILLRLGEQTGLLFPTQITGVEGGPTISYDWCFRPSGSGVLKKGDRSVEAGQAQAGEKQALTVGPLTLKWSGRCKGEGYLYYSKEPAEGQADQRIWICVTSETDPDGVDPGDARWEYAVSPFEP
jgi:hypothetical protein